MESYRKITCAYFICKGICEKGRAANHFRICQHCNKYKPRIRIRK